MKILLVLIILTSNVYANDFNSAGQKINRDSECIGGKTILLKKYYFVDLNKPCSTDSGNSEFCDADGKLSRREGGRRVQVYDSNNVRKSCLP